MAASRPYRIVCGPTEGRIESRGISERIVYGAADTASVKSAAQLAWYGRLRLRVALAYLAERQQRREKRAFERRAAQEVAVREARDGRFWVFSRPCADGSTLLSCRPWGEARLGEWARLPDGIAEAVRAASAALLDQQHPPAP